MLEARGAFTEAEPLRRRILEARERQLGPKHRETLICVNNLAAVLQRVGKFHEAPLLCPAVGSRGRVAFCFGNSEEKLQRNNQRIFRSSQFVSCILMRGNA